MRFKWSPNAIVFWDNRSTQHYPIADYWPHDREGRARDDRWGRAARRTLSARAMLPSALDVCVRFRRPLLAPADLCGAAPSALISPVRGKARRVNPPSDFAARTACMSPRSGRLACCFATLNAF
ncbi:MAG: hypothetical protein WDM79_03565 [Terricaulis sp.]